jgi:hypothetical protein
MVSPGAYQIRVQWWEGDTLRGYAKIGLAVLLEGNALLRSAQVSPNPAGRAASSRVSVLWTPDALTDTVRGSIYNVAGELIARLEAPASAGRLDWSLVSVSGESVSGGVYLWNLEALAGNYVLERRTLKFVVVH